MNKSHQFKYCMLLGSITLTMFGCSAVVKTNYQAPEVAIPTQFAYDKTKTSQQYFHDQWWTLFQDTQLNQLVNQVIEKNADLAIAGLTIQKARLTAKLTENQQGLRATSSVSTGHSIDLHQNNSSSRGISISGGVSYTIDLFGKLSSQTEASRWEALATEQDLQATAQTLIGTTCNLYWKLGYLNERLNAANDSIATSRKLLQLVQVQYKAGAVSGLELTQAQQAVQSQLATLSQLEQQRVETRTALAVLLHEPLQQLTIQEPKQLPSITLPNIQAGLPAELLARRPDLSAAELRLRKALANKDATKASYYPSISLTSSLGATSTSLTQLLKNPILTLGANLSLPFLQFNDMKRDIQISEIDYQTSIINYRKTLYQAFADVENALSNRIELNKQVEQQNKTLQLTQKSAHLYQIQYKHGAVALKPVLDAQENVRNAQINLSQLRLEQYNAYVTLMQALGGSPITSIPSTF